MAGEKGYARELLPFFNKAPGFDKVSLMCTSYDGSIAVTSKNISHIGFGSVYPQFGREGIQSSLLNGVPKTLKLMEAYSEKS